jgi:hypothetical protein
MSKEADSNIILSPGEKIFLHNVDESETEFTYVSTIVKLVDETGSWELIMQFRNTSGEIEEYPSFVIIELMRRLEMYTARFAEAAKRHRTIVQKRSQV